MKTTLEPEDIQAIASAVMEVIRPMLSGNRRQEAEDIVFDVQGLAEYLKVSHKWIYERTQFKEIPHLKVKGLLRFRKGAIDKWLDSHNTPALATPGKILSAVRRGEAASL